MTRTDDTRASYDRLAGEYARRLYGELAHKPVDRALLDAFAAELRGVGPVCEVGCGPGQVARYLHIAESTRAASTWPRRWSRRRAAAIRG
jgi:hypothetical protein